jgi:hypothetical protein
MAPKPAIVAANKHVLTSVEEQIRELQPGLQKQVEIVTISAELSRLQKIVASFPSDAVFNKDLADVIKKVTDIESGIQSGSASLSDFGEVLVDLYSLQQSLEIKLQEWLDKLQATNSDKEKLESALLAVVIRVRQLLNYRPDVGAIMDDLTAMKNLRGGPADATAFHDFQVLQLAFESVWMHAFDENLKDAAAELYKQAFTLYEDAGLTVPNFDALNDIGDLNSFINEIKNVTNALSIVAPPPLLVGIYFPEAVPVWNLFSDHQRYWIIRYANNVKQGLNPQAAKADLAYILGHPQGNAARLVKLIFEINKHLSEPYAFDVFAPNSYNFGLMITYRQKWEPGAYQAGDLVATIALAPGETRKFSKKRVVKTSRAEKEIEKSMSSRSLQTSEMSRAETEIMQKVTTATNFKMTAHGSFNIGIGNIDSTAEFTANQEQQSSLNKKAFHEATIKAAEEYRQERSIEVNTTSASETEETSSGEISNPNNEITVTYLFYELQHRFKIHEFLYRVRPVILIAQDVPAPHEIDEAWLIQYQWILSRVLLDDSLRPALDYLTSGFAGDEASIEIIKAHWEAQLSLVQELEGQVILLLSTRSAFRDDLTEAALGKSSAEAKQSTAKDVWLAINTGGLSTLFGNPGQDTDDAEAKRQAAETRLQYTEQALADAQDKLKQAANSYQQAANEYAAAMQNRFARHVAIDQLRIHVKQNILYYMQAIWDHEPTDQRFFRLYKQMVYCPEVEQFCQTSMLEYAGELSPAGSQSTNNAYATDPAYVTEWQVCVPQLVGSKIQLVEVADLDNPLGYKGNYIIFPLKGECDLTTYMLTEFIDNYLGVHDPDESVNFDAEQFDQEWKNAAEIEDKQARKKKQDELRKDLITYITAIRRSTDEIIVPTGQLFIEALPGSHPLLEDFKLLHRLEDVRKVKSEVRHAELENLRLASRLIGGQNKAELLEDPDIEKKILVDGNGNGGTIIVP